LVQKWCSWKILAWDIYGVVMASFSKRGAYWRAQIRRKGYPEQNRTFDSKAQAEAWARSIENEMDRGVFRCRFESESTTLHEALERYWREIYSQKKHPAQERQRINHWQKQTVAKYFLAHLRGHDFAKYRDARLAAGKATNTVRLELALVGHLFEIARKEWGMEGLLNPLKNIRKPSGSKERDRRLRAGEYEKLAAALDASGNPWVRPAFDLAIETSLRQGMLFKLRWSWVDLPKRVIRIPPEFRGTGNKVVPAHVPLTSKAQAVLSALPRSIDGMVLATTQNAALVQWNRIKVTIGLNDLRWHDLRHEAASRFFEAGLNPMEVASITGHKNLTMLRRYTHLAPEDLAQKLSKLG
jgi:integrase